MAKPKKEFTCESCGASFHQWFGRCPSCQSWGGIHERILEDSGQDSKRNYKSSPKELIALDQENLEETRIPLPNEELHRVFGGGLTQGSVTLLSGMPGIGKSTLLLQLLGDLSNMSEKPLIYVSGEESATQIQKRARRLETPTKNVHLLSQTNVEKTLDVLEKEQPLIVVIDSIQTMYHPNLSSIPGSVSQVREVSDRLVRFAKDQNMTFLIVGHVTKEGSIAGPMILEHLVDTVLQFEGNTDQTHRIVRCIKNRFGPTFEMGIFEMSDSGLKEVRNPSQYFLSQHSQRSTGSVIFPAMEGSRAWMVEVQALVTQSSYGTSIRNVVGMDKNRLTMLLAVLEKRGSVTLHDKDLYINIVGGLKITEPALDIAVMTAILSSVTNKIFFDHSIVFGEVGLSGEIRPTHHFDARIREAQKLGIKQVYAPIPKAFEPQKAKVDIHHIAQIQDLLDLFGKISENQ